MKRHMYSVTFTWFSDRGEERRMGGVSVKEGIAYVRANQPETGVFVDNILPSKTVVWCGREDLFCIKKTTIRFFASKSEAKVIEEGLKKEVPEVIFAMRCGE